MIVVRRNLLRALLTALLAFAGLTVATTDPATATACKPTPFTSKAHAYYRLPSVVRANNGWLVAFAEKRDNNSTSDNGNFDIVRSISTNNGCTWSGLRTIVDAGTHRASNPQIVVDRSTGQLILMSTIRTDKNYLYVAKSNNNGLRFSTPHRLQTPADGITNWHGGMTAPGNGIQLISGPHKGRLLFTVGAQDTRGYRIDVIRSDNHGRTWTVTTGARTGGTHVIEPSIAETSGDTVFLTAHDQLTNTRVQPRYRAVSTNGGTTFGSSRFVTMTTPRMPSVYANTLVPKGKYAGYLLLSGPSLVSAADPTLRKNPAIWFSRNRGQTWSRAHLIRPKGTQGSYTSMVQLSNTSLGVLFETGSRTWKERISFVRVSLATVTRR